MKKQFEYLVDLAKKYKKLNDHDDELFASLNELPAEVLRDVYEEYGDADRRFQPVNILRAKVANMLLDGKELEPEDVEEIKEKIRNKNTDYFTELSEKQLEELQDYKMGKRDLFASWLNPWTIFHTFFYRGKIKETVKQYLEQITKQLQIDLSLHDYQFHTVDFCGANNFGADICWLALFPVQKYSHKDGYQFFVRIHEQPQAGRMAGHSIREPISNELRDVSSYDEARSILTEFRDDIIKLNKETRNYFKFSPGSQAVDWNWFNEEGIAGVGYNELGLGDITEVESREKLNVRGGLNSDSNSNQVWNAWLFKTANIGDVIFAANGLNKVLGIGILEREYFYAGDKTTKYPHRRKVNWITDKVYEYTSKTYKNYSNLFRPDTFSPTKTWQFILNEYVRLYPELAEVFEEHNLKFSTVEEQSEIDIEDEEEFEGETNHWWLNANPKIWSISDIDEEETQRYTALNEKGNKRRIYKYFEAVKSGDLMIGYESTPVKQVRAIMQVTKGLHQSEKEGEVIEFEVIEKLAVPVSWGELKTDPGLKECEVFINNQGSLFKLTEDEYDIIRNTIDEKNIIQERTIKRGEEEAYNYDKDPDNPFIPLDEFEKIHSNLKRKKNIILQGPPGTGKTFMGQKLAYHHMGYQNDAQIEMVQFHQSYSYEDFIQGLRLTNNGTELRNGIFYTLCQQAHAHPKRSFFLIIDEINRGNLSKIFGELLMLIENDKRKSTFASKLTYAEDEEDTFYVPSNVYLIGTMNTADRSLAIIDYALRRRFAFITLHPIYNDEFKNFLKEKGVSDSLINHITSSVEKVNHEIKNDPNLGAGFQIGHSYFCGYNGELEESDWYRDTLQFEIKPLLEEIWFDNSEKADGMLNQLAL